MVLSKLLYTLLHSLQAPIDSKLNVNQIQKYISYQDSSLHMPLKR